MKQKPFKEPLNKSIPDLPEGGETKTKFPFPAQRQYPAGIAFGGTSLCRKEGLIDQTFLNKTLKLVCAWLTVLALSACATPPPTDIGNVCKIFEEKSSWYSAAHKAEKKWKIPTAMIMAFIHQESSFVANNKPPRKKLLGFIPWKRPSTAAGYAQATDPTWENYKEESDYLFPRRNRFKYAADFIGWYNNKTARQLRIPRNDAYNMYLAYHEGRGGYVKGSYKDKPKVLEAAKKVAKLAYTYDQQIEECRDELKTYWYSNWLNW